MIIKYITIFIGFAILVLGLIYGSLVEITFQPGHRIGVLILATIIGLILFFLFKQSIFFKKQGLKIAGLSLTGVILLPYLWIGLWTVPQAIYSDEYPMMEDVSEYKNKNGERIIGQFMEISGSLHHSQNRKVIYDFGNGIRISYLFPASKINGIWTYHRFEYNNGFVSKSDTIYTVGFKQGREIN